MLIVFISIILGIISGLYFKNKAHFCLIFILLILIIINFFRFQNFYNGLSNGDVNSQFKILYKEKETKYSICYKAEDLSKEFGKVLLYLKDNKYEYGDIVLVEGDFSLPNSKRNDGGFDYQLYLKTKGISGFVQAKSAIKQESNLTLFDIINRTIYNARIKCEKVLENTYVKDVCDFLKGLLLADTSDISNEVKEEFQNANLSHLLAISGLHVSYVYLLINKTLSRYRIGKAKRFIIIITFLLFFLMITNYPVSCTRAVIMQILALMAFLCKRKYNFINSTLISLLILLLINPYNVYNSGMWLSYGGVVGIVLFNKPIILNILKLKIKLKHIFKGKRIKTKENNIWFINNSISQNIRKRIEKYFINTIATSVSVQIVIFPIMWFCYGSVSITFVISNILISGIIGYIIMLGFISILEGFLLGIIKAILGFSFNISIVGFTNNLLVKCGLELTNFCSKLPLEKIELSKPDWIFILIYYLLLLIIFLKNTNTYVSVFRKLFNIINGRILVIFLVLSLIITQLDIKFDNKLELYMLDVGQGDSSIIVSPNNKVIVVDTGEGGKNASYDYGKNVIAPFLLAHKKHKIDYLIISHCDLDHVGGSYYLLEHFKVDNIILGVQTVETENFSKLKELADKKNVEITYMKKGDIYKLDKDLTIKVIWPDLDNIIYDNSINNMSMVFKLFCKGKSILFTGDIEEEGERKILSSLKAVSILKSDIIKVAHHGSKSSSIIDFIQAVSPEIALIGVGQNNKFGHPNNDVLIRYKKIGSKIFRTDLQGQITFSY